MTTQAEFQFQLNTAIAKGKVLLSQRSMFLGLYDADPEQTARTLTVIVDAASGQEVGETVDPSPRRSSSPAELEIRADLLGVDVSAAGQLEALDRQIQTLKSLRPPPAKIPNAPWSDVGPLAVPARPGSDEDYATFLLRADYLDEDFDNHPMWGDLRNRRVDRDRGRWEAFTRAGIDPVHLTWDTARRELLYGADVDADPPTGGLVNYRHEMLLNAQIKRQTERQRQARLDAEEEERKQIERAERERLAELRRMNPHIGFGKTRGRNA